jgi:ribosomal protein S18 acetylase RimI-like enzyme
MERTDIEAVVELFAAAFQNAPLYRYFESDDERRPDFLRMIFRNRLGFGFEDRRADLALVEGTLSGAAMWTPPAAPRTENHALNDGIRRYRDGAVVEKWRRFHEVLFGLLERACAVPHWSIAPIAVLPAAQGRGIASALIRPRLAEIEAAGEQCLLGTQDEVNTKIYARYGFRLVGETVAAKGANGTDDLKCYAMLR